MTMRTLESINVSTESPSLSVRVIVEVGDDGVRAIDRYKIIAASVKNTIIKVVREDMDVLASAINGSGVLITIFSGFKYEIKDIDYEDPKNLHRFAKRIYEDIEQTMRDNEEDMYIVCVESVEVRSSLKDWLEAVVVIS